MEDILEWGHCLDTCPSEEIRPVCQTLPEHPFISMLDMAGPNYTTNAADVVDTNDVTLGVNNNISMLECLQRIILISRYKLLSVAIF